MTERHLMLWMISVITIATIGFVTWAFGWQVAVAVFLVMWWFKLERRIDQ